MFDDEQNDEQYLRDLYSRFRKDVLENNPQEYYTQDELLDIYDFAQDESDHLVMMHVLLCGARYYNESDFLDERKAFFLSSISSDSARGMLNRKGRKDTPLWRVLDISLKCVDGMDPSESLAALLDSGMTLDSEAVIWLIDNLHAAHRHDLIAQNIEQIVEMAEDPAEVYHSAALAFYNEGGELYVHALSYVEELTKLDSFFVEGWILNARIEFQLDHFQEALQAIDYALALDPENAEAAWVKSMIMPMTVDSDDIPAIIEHIKVVIKNRPDWLPATVALATQYDRLGNRGAMFETFDAFINRNSNPDSIQEIAITALKYNPENPDKYLDAIDRSIEMGSWGNDYASKEQQWNKLAIDLIGEGKTQTAQQIFEYYHQKYGLKFFMYNYIAVMYRNRDYARIVSFSHSALMESESSREIAQDDIEGIFERIKGYTYVTGALLKTGDYAATLQLAGKLLNDIPDMIYNVNDTIYINGLRLQLRFVEHLALHPELIPDSDEFDPLTTLVDMMSFTSGRGDIPAN